MAWAGALAWLADHSPPFVAGFLGAFVGAIAGARWLKRRKRPDAE